MLIHLNTDDQDLVSRVYLQIQDQFPSSTIHTDQEAVNQYVPRSGEHILTSGTLELPRDAAHSRWAQLRFAALGGRIWVPTNEHKFPSPAIAGAFDGIASLRQIVTDALFAEGRADYYRSFGVNYIGRVFSDPRVVILLDNKRDKLHNPENSEDVYKILSSLPELRVSEGSWESVALVSAGNVTKLEEFLDYLSETNVVAYTTGAFAKLNFIGRDYGQIPAPTEDPRYGKTVLDIASRMKPQLAI